MPILSPRIDIAPSRLAPFAYSEQIRGLYAVGLYVVQMGLGIFIHYIRIPFPFIGHRPPLNYFHGLLGLVTLVLANYQVRLCQRCLLHRAFFCSSVLGNQIYDGLYHKSSFLAADVRQSAKHAWLALLIVRYTAQTWPVTHLPNTSV